MNKIKKHIGLKISLSLLGILLVCFSITQFIIVSEFKKSSLKLSEDSLDMLSSSIFQTMRGAMAMGDEAITKKALSDASKLKGIKSIKVHKSQAVIDGYGLNAQVSNEEIIKNQFKNPKKMDIEVQKNSSHELRLILPLLAEKECLSCHPSVELGDTLGVMDIAYSFDEIDNALDELNIRFIVIFAVALILTLLLLILTLNYVIKNPLEELMARVKDLSSGDGDLTARVIVKSHDEVGKVGKYINTFIHKIQDTVKVTQDISKDVDDTSYKLNTDAQSLFKSTSDQSKQMQVLHELGDSMEKQMQYTSQLAQDAKQNNEEANALLGNMISSLENIVQDIITSSDNESELASRMKTLVDQAAQIQSVLGLIKEISEQINLLSLNATIEAARAGEHGRGFAVVADEVRMLADKTQKSLGEIESTVSVILQGINNLSEDMIQNAQNTNELRDKADNLMKNASSTQEKTQKTIKLINKSSKETTNVSNITKELKSNSISTLEISKKNEKIAQGLLQISTDLKQAADKLEDKLLSFKAR
ncbi:MAG: chemotaxis protein [Proteobacteria bacterium]|nr:MAG: chemotaxis protein [Pseudomonadota bacterium]